MGAGAPLERHTEWLEADGLSGFASGTVSGVRTRRYHALLLVSTAAGRRLLVNGIEAWVGSAGGWEPLSSHRYLPGVTHPDGERRIESFAGDPWPQWTFRLATGARLRHEVIVPKGTAAVVLSWKLLEKGPGGVVLRVRPLMSGRDIHATHHENSAFRFEPRSEPGRLIWRPYEGVPEVEAIVNGRYEHDPVWYRQFLYEQERARGLDDTEDLASPGSFVFDLDAREAVIILRVAENGGTLDRPAWDPLEKVMSWRSVEEKRRSGFGSSLSRAGDAYLVESRGRRTIIAGYPWFTDWGRDTFIALRGLCLATGRLKEADEILHSWAPAVSEGLLPNLFPDGGAPPEYNTVDGALWYVVAAGEYLDLSRETRRPIPKDHRAALILAIEAILQGYSRGTRFGIHADTDGLLASGAPEVSLTWMDARLDGRAVTPRRGKPVEVQALWLNALLVGSRLAGPASAARWAAAFEKGLESFRSRFWNERDQCLFDVVDVEGEAGTVDMTIRPNQIFAVGGLPRALLAGPRAFSVVQRVEGDLLTPAGLRTLAPQEAGYAPRYEGGPRERDAAYHQGTVWPWLMGPFVEAWVRVRGETAAAQREARARFLDPLLAATRTVGIGHLFEIADAETPHRPKGCPFQAWSVGEAIRLDRWVLAEPPTSPSSSPRRSR